MPGRRSFAVGRFFLELDGVDCGFVRSVEGGGVSADVVSQPGPDYFEKKHLGGLRYEELELRVDLSLDAAVYAWIAETWTGKTRRRDGSLVVTDLNRKAVSEQEFFQALLTAVTIPALDAASKEPAFMTVRFAPEYTRAAKASGKTVKAVGAKQKAWLPANFKLEIDGLDCTKVSKVDAFTVRQKVAAEAVGELRDYQKEPGRLEFPNLRITLAETSAQTWRDWHDDFVVKGNNDDSKERSGKLTFLAPNLKDVLGEVRLFGLGIFRLAREPQPEGAQQIARLQADLYCERMELSVSP